MRKLLELLNSKWLTRDWDFRKKEYIELLYEVEQYMTLLSVDESKNMEDNEIKASNGGKGHDSYNYVQLRMNHKLNNYILTAYHLTEDNLSNSDVLTLLYISEQTF